MLCALWSAAIPYVMYHGILNVVKYEEKVSLFM
jgi:hypothetical protein